MRIAPTQEELNHRKDVWQTILGQMKAHRITPKELADKTPYSQDLIERGIGGEPIPIRLDFVRACVKAFKLAELVEIDGRTKDIDYEKSVGALSYEDCVERMKPPSAMPPRQGNFWEWDDYGD